MEITRTEENCQPITSQQANNNQLFCRKSGPKHTQNANTFVILFQFIVEQLSISFGSRLNWPKCFVIQICVSFLKQQKKKKQINICMDYGRIETTDYERRNNVNISTSHKHKINTKSDSEFELLFGQQKLETVLNKFEFHE